MREGIVAYDMKLRLAFVNPAFERLTGYAEEDIRDQEFLQYIHPDDRPALTAEWELLAQGGSLRDQEYRVVTRTGQHRWSSSSWEPLRDEAGPADRILGTEFDITERKLAEEAMRLDTELFQAMIEVQQAVAAAGLDSQTVMRVIADRGIRLTGADGAVIESIEGDELVPQVHIGLDAPRLRLADSLSGLGVRTGELQRSDDVFNDPRIGHDAYRNLGIRSLLAVPLTDEQRTLGVLKVVATRPNAFSDRDAKAVRLLGGLMGAALGHAAAYESRQLRLEERTRALQESEQRFKQLVDVAQEGIWLADDRGVITYVNQRMAELLGYQNGAMLGRRVYDFIDAASRAGAQRTLARPSASGGESRDLRFLRRDGGELWGLVSASPIVGRDGGLVGTVGMVTDITERKRGGGAAAPLRGAAGHAARHGTGGARGPLPGGDRPRGPGADPADGSLPALLHRAVRLPQGPGAAARGIRRRQPALHRADPARPALPGEVLRRGTVRYVEDSPPPRRRRRSSSSSGGRHPQRALVPLLVDGEAIGEVNLAAARPAPSTRSTATSRWRWRPRWRSRSSTPACATS